MPSASHSKYKSYGLVGPVGIAGPGKELLRASGTGNDRVAKRLLKTLRQEICYERSEQVAGSADSRRYNEFLGWPSMFAHVHADGSVERLAFASSFHPFEPQQLKLAPLAQLDRASGYEPEGREFESLRAHHLLDSNTIDRTQPVSDGSSQPIPPKRSFRPRCCKQRSPVSALAGRWGWLELRKTILRRWRTSEYSSRSGPR